MASPLVIKSAVKDKLKDTLSEFTVTWGFTTRNVPRKWCYLGDLSWPESEWVTNRSRQHVMSMPIVLNAIFVKKNAEQAETFLQDQLTAIEEAFNADSTLRDTGVITWGINPRMLGTQPHDEGIEGQAVIELQVTYRP